MSGYIVTPATKRVQRAFARTLDPEGEPNICPPGCRENHDLGKQPGRDHWESERAREARLRAERLAARKERREARKLLTAGTT